MSKKVSKMLLISILLFTMVFAFLTKNLIKGQISYDKVTIQNELEEQLKTIIVGEHSQYYKNIGVSLEPKDVTIENGVANAIFDAKIDLTLRAEKVEDLPFMKGMLNYLNSRKATASKAQIEEANKLIEDWKLELKDYIGKPEPTGYATFKIVANVRSDSSIDPNSAKLYVSEPSTTSKGESFYPVPLPMFETTEKMEKNGEKTIEEIFKKVGDSLIISNTNEAKYTYNRLDARDYANSWTSNAPDNGDCLMDSSKWNNDEYPYYDNAYCNDCADYVSQALHEGGIPIDPGQWERLKDEYGDYTWAWTSVFSLKDYMYNNGHWTTSNFTNANAGCVIRMQEYDYHAVMIVLNDTIHRQFSGHTNDRKQYPYYSSNGWEYYAVQ